jgi:hypothetical protein
MNPPLELIIPLAGMLTLFVALPAVILRGILAIQRQKQEASQAGGIGVGELEDRLEQAVVRATNPLRAQLDRLEARLDRLEAPRSDRLDSSALDLDEPPAEKTVGRRRRTT